MKSILASPNLSKPGTFEVGKRNDLRFIQMLQGHNSLKTIEIYTHVAMCTFVQNDTSFISISCTAKGALLKGYGIEITLTNVQTKTNYKSKSLGRISSHSIIENLPSGRYIVSKTEIPLGELKYVNKSPEMTKYLGDFRGIREVGKHNVFHLSIIDSKIPEKLLLKLKKKEINIEKQDFIKTYSYTKDVLTVY